MTARGSAAWAVLVLMTVATVGVAAQDSLQKTFERGDYGSVVERAGEGRGGSPEDTYLAGLAYMKMGNTDAAAAEMRRLQEQGDAGWQQIGASELAVLEGNHGEAVTAGRRATEQAGDSPFAHYQLGYAALGANDLGTATQELARAAELKPDFAYTHYYAGQAFQKQRNLGRAADYYAYFLKLAPDAPERPAVQAIMRTLRK